MNRRGFKRPNLGVSLHFGLTTVPLIDRLSRHRQAFNVAAQSSHIHQGEVLRGVIGRIPKRRQ